MSGEVRCRCCGIPVFNNRARVRVCPICDQCDELHGDALQIKCAHEVLGGRMDPGLALTRALIDDAQLTGRIVFVETPGEPGATIMIFDPPKRWQVVCARAKCRGELPELQTIVDVILARYIPGKCTRATLDAIARELTEALSFLDPSILSVDVDSKRDALDPEHLIINIKATTPTLGAVTVTAPDVEIPDDIMLRARGQA